jgi:acetyl esterase/lipase
LVGTLDQLKGLPPAQVIVDENDIIREDGEEYARKAMQAGVEVSAARALAAVDRIPGYFCHRWGEHRRRKTEASPMLRCKH